MLRFSFSYCFVGWFCCFFRTSCSLHNLLNAKSITHHKHWTILQVHAEWRKQKKTNTLRMQSIRRRRVFLSFICFDCYQCIRLEFITVTSSIELAFCFLALFVCSVKFKIGGKPLNLNWIKLVGVKFHIQNHTIGPNAMNSKQKFHCSKLDSLIWWGCLKREESHKRIISIRVYENSL